LTLPAIPDLGMSREAIAAAFGEDPAGPVDQDPGAEPAQQSAAPPSVAQPSVPQSNSPQAHVTPTSVTPTSVTPTSVTPTSVTPTNVTAPLPTPSTSPAGGTPAAGVAGHRLRPVVPAPGPSAQPPLRRLSGLRYRPPLAVGSPRTPVQFVARRRRVSRQALGLPPQTRSSGGAGAFFLIAFIILGVLAYGIIAGIVESILRLFQ
jgi:hypothetical protein